MAYRTLTAIMFVSVALLFGSGCTRTYEDSDTGVVARYEWDTLKAKLDEGIATVYPAAHAAADELDLRILRHEIDGIAAQILALDAHFDIVDIRLEALPEARTLLAIRIGQFGDDNKSVVLFGSIMENLAEFPRVADGVEPRRHRVRPDRCNEELRK